MASSHLSISELAADLSGILARVRAGEQILVDDQGSLVAVLQPPAFPIRTGEESLTLVSPDSPFAMDDEFARDVEEGVVQHREGLREVEWD